MLIEKAKILELLRSRGQDTRADWVDRELPPEVDTYLHAGLLVTLRLTPADIAELVSTAASPADSIESSS